MSNARASRCRRTHVFVSCASPANEDRPDTRTLSDGTPSHSMPMMNEKSDAEYFSGIRDAEDQQRDHNEDQRADDEQNAASVFEWCH
jgi:hypothetical protein